MLNSSLIELEIIKVVNGGYGLGRLNNLVYLVPFAYPGDKVLIKSFSTKKNMVWGEVIKIIESSPDRQEKRCPQMGNCGSCIWGMLNYQKQIEYKKQILRENIYHYIRKDKNVEMVYDETYKYHYRTRVIYHGNGNNLGFYKFHSKEIADVSACVLVYEKIEDIRRNLIQEKIVGEVYITINPYTNEYLLFTQKLNKNLIKNYKNVYDYSNSNNNRKYFLFNKIPIVNGCFAQNSLFLNDILKQQVNKFLKHGEKILDLYCGSGNFTIDLEPDKHVVGIDIDPYAVNKAKECSKFEYVVGDENLMNTYLQKEDWDIVLLDPPRTGAKMIIPSLNKAKTDTIIYVSCDSVTMCRDIKELSLNGWEIQEVIGVDMFPQTPHIECITVLKK